MILGASFDDERANAAFAAKYNFPFRLLCDTDRTLGLAYGATETAAAQAPKRISYLIDTEGIIRKTWPQVSVRQHADDVLAALPG